MRIVKRGLGFNPKESFTLWAIPSMTYLIMKVRGTVSFHKEWLWWVVIPTLFVVWILINWKIKK
jgi:hypothetical protein